MKNSIKLSIAFLLFFIFNSSLVKGQSNENKDRVYVKIEVKGMACAYCAYGMEKKLKKVSGVNNVSIQLEEGMAYISTPKEQKPQKESLILIVQNAGFTPGIIEYSNTPYHIEKKELKKKN